MGGTDKAFMRVGGEASIARIVAVLRPHFRDIIVVSNQPQKYANLHDVAVVSDRYPGRGPLAGLHSGLLVSQAEEVFLVACDMPFLRWEPVRYLAQFMPGPDAVVPYWEGDVEPLHAFYSRRVLPIVEELLHEGRGGMRELLARLDVRYVPERDMAAVPGAEESFRNLNTIADADRFAVELDGGR